MQPIHFNTIVNRISTRVDGSLSLSMETPELSNDAILVMLRLRGINLNCVLTPLNTALEEPVEVESSTEVKSPSQRLRSVIYAVFAHEKQAGKVSSEEIFETFYPRTMEKLIEFCKKRLPNND